MARTHPWLTTFVLLLAYRWTTAAAFADVRTKHPTIAALIDGAAEGSGTFHGLIAEIEAANGIVYVTPGRCGRIRACLVHRITTAGRHRVLTIIVDPQRDDVALMAALGHELQHAVEVLKAPDITTDAEMHAFYWSHGVRMRGVIETRAAIQTGNAVRRELRAAGW
jgi:hypothetical protein